MVMANARGQDGSDSGTMNMTVLAGSAIGDVPEAVGPRRPLRSSVIVLAREGCPRQRVP